MEWNEWMPFYDAISRDLSLDRSRDEMSCSVLSSLLLSNPNLSDPDETLLSAHRLMLGRDVYVLGAGPGLEAELDRLITEMTAKGRWGDDDTAKDVLVAADGATSAALGRGYVPQVIVTDLDGDAQEQMICLERGSIMFVHAHGDNIPLLNHVVPRLRGPVVGTTQIEPPGNAPIYNFGGFSDGDRAAFIAQHFGCASITLLGFDLETPAMKLGKGGGRKVLDEAAYDRKFRKLTWANVLLALINEPRVRFFDQEEGLI